MAAGAAAQGADVSPESFGAKGDGKSDDTAAFKQAMAKLKAGGTLNLESGKTYLVDAPFRVGSGVSVKSTSTKAATLRLKLTGSGTFGVYIDKADGVTLDNLVIDSAKGDLGTVVMISNSKNVTVSNSRFHDNEKSASGFVRIKDSNFIKVQKSEFDNGYEAVNIYGICSNIEVSDNDIHGVRQYGVRVQGTAQTSSSKIKILRNKVRDMTRPAGQTAGHPIYVHIGEGVGGKRHQQIDVIGNTLLGINKAFASGGNGDMIEYCDVETGNVSENKAEGGGDVGIAIVRCEDIMVEKNSAGFNNSNGIVIWESHRCKVLNNRAYNNNQDRDKQWGNKYFKGGIRVMARTGFSDDNEVTGNKSWDDQLTKTQDYGIYLMKGARRTKIGKNDLSGNKFGEMRDESTNFLEPVTLLDKKVRRLHLWK